MFGQDKLRVTLRQVERVWIRGVVPPMGMWAFLFPLLTKHVLAARAAPARSLVANPQILVQLEALRVQDLRFRVNRRPVGDRSAETGLCATQNSRASESPRAGPDDKNRQLRMRSHVPSPSEDDVATCSGPLRTDLTRQCPHRRSGSGSSKAHRRTLADRKPAPCDPSPRLAMVIARPAPCTKPDSARNRRRTDQPL